jgi:hypothetical protein
MRRWVYDKDGNSREIDVSPRIDDLHYVQGDIAEFRSPDGAYISGRMQWREHLERTGQIEMGHSDLKATKEKWDKKKEAFKERINKPVPKVPLRGEVNVMESREHESRINSEIKNRLDGRPAPDRKTLIKLTLETAQDLARRR